MSERLSYYHAAPEAIKALRTTQRYLLNTSLSPALLELVYLRTSQINGCAFCMELHGRQAASLGESAMRINCLSAWEEAGMLFTDAERAALAWSECVATVARSRVPQSVYDDAKLFYTDKELVDLTLAVALVTTWNMLGVAFRTAPRPDYWAPGHGASGASAPTIQGSAP